MAERRISWIATEGRNYLDYFGYSEAGGLRGPANAVSVFLGAETSSGGNRQASGHLFASLHTRRHFEARFQAVSPRIKSTGGCAGSREEASDTYIASVLQVRNRKLDLSAPEVRSFFQS